MKKYSLIKRGSYHRISLIRYSFLIIIIAGVIALGILLVPRILSGAVNLFWLPFDTVRVWVMESGGSFSRYFNERGVLLNELDQLQIQVAMQQANENSLHKLQVENQDFRSLLEAVPDDRLLATVVARPNQLPYDQLLINRGFNQGVEENVPVFLGKDQVIGLVSKVQANTSLVTLISTPGFRATAYIVGPNIYTYTEGMGGGIVRVQVPQGVLLQTGNLVMFPAIDSGVYGSIDEISTSPTQPEQYGYVTTGTSLQNLQYVTIGRTPISPHSFEEVEQLVEAVTSNLLLVPVPVDKLVTTSVINATSSTVDDSGSSTTVTN